MWSIAPSESRPRAPLFALLKHLAGGVALSLAMVSPAQADPPTDTSAAARVLFYEGRELMKAGRHGIACLKLEQSLALEYGIGTEFNLADCNERRGRLSTAWAGFVHVAEVARTQEQRERASERARTLEPRVPKLAIDIPSDAPPHIEVARDGESVAPPLWGQPVPVDPGVHRVTAAADGMTPWQLDVTVSESALVRVSVPRDAKVAAAVRPALEIARAAAPAPELAPTTTRAAEPEVPAALPLAQRSEAPVAARSEPWRTLGWIGAGVGLVGVGVGVGFGVDSYRKQQAAKDRCEGEVCDPRGLALRASAMKSGDVATIATGAGALVLAAGVVTLLVTGGKPARAQQPRCAFEATPLVAANGGGLLLHGVLP